MLSPTDIDLIMIFATCNITCLEDIITSYNKNMKSKQSWLASNTIWKPLDLCLSKISLLCDLYTQYTCKVMFHFISFL